MIGVSEQGAAHNRILPRCLFSQRCTRSWRSRGWPLSWPEAARLPPLSSLPSMAGLPGGTRAFPRWRERSRCTCAHKMLPLGGMVHVSHPKPVSWRMRPRTKLKVLRVRQPLPCMPWLSCRYTKPKRSNKCTRVVPTGLFSDTVEGFAQQFSVVQKQTEAIQHILPQRDAPSATAAPGTRPPASSRAALPCAESTPRLARRATRRSAAPPWCGQPRDVGVCFFSGDGEDRVAPSPGRGPGGESYVSFYFCSAAGPWALVHGITRSDWQIGSVSVTYVTLVTYVNENGDVMSPCHNLEP